MNRVGRCGIRGGPFRNRRVRRLSDPFDSLPRDEEQDSADRSLFLPVLLLVQKNALHQEGQNQQEANDQDHARGEAEMELYFRIGHTECMLPKKILSLQHPLVKHWVSLRKDKAYREEQRRVLIMGKREVSEQKNLVLISTEHSPLPAQEHYLVSEEILKKITGLQAPDGFAAEVGMPSSQDIRSHKRILILDRLADPGNLGTLLRTALALGWEGVIAMPHTVDFFNDKALRAGKGAIFRLPYMQMDEKELSAWVQEKNIQLYIADTEGTPLDSLQLREPMALVLSAEGEGPSAWAKKLGEKITIPMSPSVESLNVAASGAILLYTLIHQ